MLGQPAPDWPRWQEEREEPSDETHFLKAFGRQLRDRLLQIRPLQADRVLVDAAPRTEAIPLQADLKRQIEDERDRRPAKSGRELQERLCRTGSETSPQVCNYVWKRSRFTF